MAYPVYLVMTNQDILLNDMYMMGGTPVAVVVGICTSGNLPNTQVFNNSNAWLHSVYIF